MSFCVDENNKIKSMIGSVDFINVGLGIVDLVNNVVKRLIITLGFRRYSAMLREFTLSKDSATYCKLALRASLIASIRATFSASEEEEEEGTEKL